ncbi:MAG: DUF4412 domain-containing protein [Bacteroidales bacterium]|nr:DUF4412 domain-containing protein [Bacteroidales bacterium]
MMVTKNLILIKLYILLAFTGYAEPKLQNFEGSINLERKTIYDTSFLTIQVKGKLVRMDEFDSKMNSVSILIINLESEKILALSPKRKLFYELKTNKINQTTKEDTIVIKTENRMMLNGYYCSLLRVKSISHDTETAFWVAERNFPFFKPLNKILQNIKSEINLFSYFPDISGQFPMLTVERTLLRKEKMKISVTEINETLLSENLFKIPSGYQKIEQ